VYAEFIIGGLGESGDKLILGLSNREATGQVRDSANDDSTGVYEVRGGKWPGSIVRTRAHNLLYCVIGTWTKK